MFGVILPAIGAVGGFVIGGAGGVRIGAAIGSVVGGLLDGSVKSRNYTLKMKPQSGPHLDDLSVQTSTYGNVIPQVYGTMRLSGNVIWASNLWEHEHHESHSSTSGDVTTVQDSYNYSYTSTIAIGICAGKVDKITRIWANGKLLTYDDIGFDKGNFKIYYGDEEQLPDEIIWKYKILFNNKSSPPPGYRGLCYVVIKDFPLGNYGNHLPSFSFEVTKSVRQIPSVEDKVREVILIPGSGEFVYSSNVCYKTRRAPFGALLEHDVINMHNHHGRANALVALDQMQKTLPNLEWVGLVVTWFATSSKCGNCKIVPKVEFKQNRTKTEPEEWSVIGLNRKEAESVLYFDEFTPTYGGTPSDHTIIEIIEELKSRGLKLMFYPMIFVDEIEPKPKPWRGRITANSSEEIDKWFDGTEGYNRFILHYANLIGSKVEAFVIGSEMVGLTGFTEKEGNYPAVNQFVNLANSVKERVSDNCLVTYAADWSEYHHSEGGWFNLDPLWSCDSIDFIGIDAYFPLTEDLPQSQITEEIIKKGWEKGEGWDYYYDGDNIFDRSEENKRQFDKPTYAWKNLEYWWSNEHRNPNGELTDWKPKMKPVWFSEMGFASVDCCSNQPNVFYDPSSTESYFPRGSSGQVDFFAQRQGLNASLDYLNERNQKMGLENLVPKSFIWSYDARPYPHFPDYTSIWQDYRLWKYGHWINGKFGMSSLAAIIADILIQIGLKTYQFTLPPKYAYLEPSDVIEINTRNRSHSDADSTNIYRMRIIKTDMHRTGQLRIVATNYNAENYNFHSETEYTETEYQIPELLSYTGIELIDTPTLPTDHNPDEAVIRLAIYPQGNNWNGVAIYANNGNSDDDNYELLVKTENIAIIGFSKNILSDADSTIIDQGSELIIELISGSLSSITADRLLNNGNLAMIGNELIQFQNVELLEDNSYKLTNLLRGRQGTEMEIGAHKENERFILLDNNIVNIRVNSDLIGTPINYKAVSIGRSLAATNSVELIYAGKNLKPFAPVHVQAIREENSNNINISWIRRARHSNCWRNNVDVPIVEESEKYEIDIIHNNTVIHTQESDTTNVTYNNQNNLQNLTANIYQISEIVGRGYAASITL